MLNRTSLWKLLLLWVVANTLGIVFAGFVSTYVGFFIGGWVASLVGINFMQESEPMSFSAGYVSSMVTFAALASLVQWLMLRVQTTVTARWIVVTVLGAVVGTVVGITIVGIAIAIPATAGLTVFRLFKPFVVMSVGASAIAPSQWLVLRRHLTMTLWWIPTSALGVVGCWVVNWYFGLFVYVLITGLWLERVLRRQLG